MEIIINIGTHGATHYTTRLDTGDPRHTGTQMCDPKMTQHHGGEDRKLEEKKRKERKERIERGSRQEALSLSDSARAVPLVT